ncbi:MAG: hypothetical protein QXK11_05810 [Pyrobaculum sp.]|uniref:hypothetical protein n=1 Tax=Pyrobaculum sp. TaxID=2004705 RepID=UPI00316AAEC9
MQKIILLAVLAAALVLAQNATAAAGNATLNKFHLWLKCKAIELYINTTGANFTLPQCEEILQNYTFHNLTFIIGRAGVRPLPMIGVGELRKLNVSDPKAVFEQLKEIRRQALANLTRHVAKAVNKTYEELNETENLTNLAKQVERGLKALQRVKYVLARVNASKTAIEAVELATAPLNETKQLLELLKNATDEKGLAKAEAIIAGLEKRLQLLEKLPLPAREIVVKHVDRIKQVITKHIESIMQKIAEKKQIAGEAVAGKAKENAGGKASESSKKTPGVGGSAGRSGGGG